MTFQERMEREGYLSLKLMKNGEWVGVMRMNFTFGVFVGMDEDGYRGRYCYERQIDAMFAAKEYEGIGDPPGPWIKYKGSDGQRLGPGAKVHRERGGLYNG